MPSKTRKNSVLCIARDGMDRWMERCGTNNYKQPVSIINDEAWEFSAENNFALSVSIRMPWFKKSKKSRQPSQQAAALGIPTHVAVGPLGLSADLAPDISPEGVSRSMKSSNRWG